MCINLSVKWNSFITLPLWSVTGHAIHVWHLALKHSSFLMEVPHVSFSPIMFGLNETPLSLFNNCTIKCFHTRMNIWAENLPFGDPYKHFWWQLRNFLGWHCFISFLWGWLCMVFMQWSIRVWLRPSQTARSRRTRCRHHLSPRYVEWWYFLGDRTLCWRFPAPNSQKVQHRMPLTRSRQRRRYITLKCLD